MNTENKLLEKNPPVLSKKRLNVLVFVSALLAIIFDYAENHLLFTIFKPLTTILIILIPLIHGNRSVKTYWRSTIIALFFCLAGDTFLLKEEYFVFGLASFLIAHILFMVGFVSIGGFKYNLFPLLLLLSIGGSYYGFIYENLNDLALPVFLYFIFIMLMCWQGINVYLWKRNTVFAYIGIAVVLFLISDSIIALSKFQYAFDLSGLLILSTYWLSISLLANSTTMIDTEMTL